MSMWKRKFKEIEKEKHLPSDWLHRWVRCVLVQELLLLQKHRTRAVFPSYRHQPVRGFRKIYMFDDYSILVFILFNI